jgi:hypothetical protein
MKSGSEMRVSRPKSLMFQSTTMIEIIFFNFFSFDKQVFHAEIRVRMKEKRDKAVKKCFAYMQKNASHNFSVAGTFDKAVKKVFVEGEAFFLKKIRLHIRWTGRSFTSQQKTNKLAEKNLQFLKKKMV